MRKPKILQAIDIATLHICTTAIEVVNEQFSTHIGMKTDVIMLIVPNEPEIDEETQIRALGIASNTRDQARILKILQMAVARTEQKMGVKTS